MCLRSAHYSQQSGFPPSFEVSSGSIDGICKRLDHPTLTVSGMSKVGMSFGINGHTEGSDLDWGMSSQ
jgi:hypothetical protein